MIDPREFTRVGVFIIASSPIFIVLMQMLLK